MCKVSHKTLIVLSGLVWLAAGAVLLPLGINFIVAALLEVHAAGPHPALDLWTAYAGGLEQAALAWVAVAIAVGMFKGRYVLSKTVQRSIDRIASLPNPASLSQIYAPAYYLLLGAMIALGVAMRWLPQDIRGVIDIAVGCALIHGAMLYFRQALCPREPLRCVVKK